MTTLTTRYNKVHNAGLTLRSDPSVDASVDRFLAMSPTSRGLNALLYNSSLGKFAEETMAGTAASDSIIAGLNWGWNYPGVSHGWVIGQTGLVLGAGAGTGYTIKLGVEYVRGRNE